MILGEGKLAYMLSLSGFISYYVVCPECENCDEEMEVGYFELSERMKEAKAPSGKWDGRSLEDVKLWLPNLFRLLEDEEGEELLYRNLCMSGMREKDACADRDGRVLFGGVARRNRVGGNGLEIGL